MRHRQESRPDFLTAAACDALGDSNRPSKLAGKRGYGGTLTAGAKVMTMIRRLEIRRVDNAFSDALTKG